MSDTTADNQGFYVSEEDNMSNLAKLLQICGREFIREDWHLCCSIINSQTHCKWHHGIPCYSYKYGQELAISLDMVGISICNESILDLTSMNLDIVAELCESYKITEEDMDWHACGVQTIVPMSADKAVNLIMDQAQIGLLAEIIVSEVARCIRS